MPLIIRIELVGPPTWPLSFRDLTLACNALYRIESVIETDGNPDVYWRWLKKRGGMDFVEDFIRPGSEKGVRLDFKRRLPFTVMTDRIIPENVHNLIGRIVKTSAWAA